MLLGNRSHTTMHHDTTIVLEHSFRYRKSLYFYHLFTVTNSSDLYIDCLVSKWTWLCKSGFLSLSLRYNRFKNEQSININRMSSDLLLFLLPLYCVLSTSLHLFGYVHPLFFFIFLWITELIANNIFKPFFAHKDINVLWLWKSRLCAWNRLTKCGGIEHFKVCTTWIN